MTTIASRPERFDGEKSTKCRRDFTVVEGVFSLILQFSLLLRFLLNLNPKAVYVGAECVEWK